MVLGIAQRMVEDLRTHVETVEVVGPGSAFINFLQLVVSGVVINGVESGVEQVGHYVASAAGIAGGHFCRIVIVGFRCKKDLRIPRPGAGDHPVPEFRRDHMSHVGAEPVDAEFLPVGDDLIHLPPCVGNGNILPVAVRVGARLLLRIGEIVSVVQLDGFIPASRIGFPAHDIIASDAPVFAFRCKKPVAWGFCHLACRAGGIPLSIHGGEAERRAVACGLRIRREPVKIVVRPKKFCLVIVRAEAEFWADDGLVAACDVVRHEVHDDFEPCLVDPVDHRAILIEAVRGIIGVVGTHVEIIPDGIGTPGKPLEKIGIIRGSADRGIIRCRRLPEDAGRPDMRKAHGLDCRERRLVQVAEFSATIFFDRAIGFPGLIRISKNTREELVDPDFFGRCRWGICQGGCHDGGEKKRSESQGGNHEDPGDYGTSSTR